MQKEDLEEKVVNGWSIQDLATEFGKGKATIRYWLKQFNLVTKGKAGAKNTISAAIDAGNTHKKCAKCAEEKTVDNFFYRKDRNSYASYCKTCDAYAVLVRETNTKLACIDYLGNKCKKCNLTLHYSVYDFHHVEPEHKDFDIRNSKSKNFLKVKDELDKCILLCANCHHHTHYEMKIESGYNNSIVGNTELWQDNKRRKLEFKKQTCCEQCGYNTYEGSLLIIYPEGFEHLRKYNKTHWDDDFRQQLTAAKVMCYNCLRKSKSRDVTNELG